MGLPEELLRGCAPVPSEGHEVVDDGERGELAGGDAMEVVVPQRELPVAFMQCTA